MLLRIDRSSIRPNPNAGIDYADVPGRRSTIVETVHILDGEHCLDVSCNGVLISRTVVSPQPLRTVIRAEQSVLRLYMPGPEPAWLYSYEDAEFCCVECGSALRVSELESDDFGDDEAGTAQKCPRCGTWDAVGTPLAREHLTDAQLFEVFAAAQRTQANA